MKTLTKEQVETKKVETELVDPKTVTDNVTVRKSKTYRSLSSQYRHDKAELKLQWKTEADKIDSKFRKKLTALDKDLFADIRDLEAKVDAKNEDCDDKSELKKILEKTSKKDLIEVISTLK